jgi:hypothetical protein
MKHLLGIFFTLFFIGFGFAQSYNYQNLHVRVAENDAKAHYTFKNLRLYPIRAKESFLKGQYVGKYTPLRTALANKQVVISELKQPISLSNTRTDSIRIPPQERRERTPITPRTRRETRNNTPQTNDNPQQVVPQQIQISSLDAGIGTVNTLQLENTSKDTIYIMAGEIVQGGKQDRVIAQDMVLPPASGVMNMSVFCVEQGRWKYNSTDSSRFQTHYGAGSVKLRKTVEKTKNQQAVWSEVRRSNNEHNVNTETQAYTAQKEVPYLKKNTEEYLAYFQKALENEQDIIGVLVVTGDKVVGCDLFASPALFQSQITTLLPSYIAEALTDGSPVNVKAQTVQNYLDNLLKEETQSSFIEKHGKTFEHQNKKLRISTF